MKKTILVTGATGSVSSALLDVLGPSTRTAQVRALVRREEDAEKMRVRGIDAALGDLDDADTLTAAFEGVSDVWYLSPPGPRAPENSMNAVWAARRSGVKRIVRMSAIGAAHDAPTRNGRLHALSDAELQASGMRWTILRPHFFMQNLLNAAGAVGALGALPFAMGGGKLGLVDARDIAAVAAAVLLDETSKHDGKVYTPTGPASIGLAEVASVLSETLGRDVAYQALSEDAAREMLLGFGMSPWLVGMTLEYSRAYANGWGDFVTTDVQDVTGRPARDVRTFVRDQWPR